MKTNLESIMKYRINQAKESLTDAKILMDSRGSLRSIINRSYYAMFYVLLALISQKGFGSSKHSGVISFFDKEYVKKNIFPKRMSQLLHKAFYFRQECDYKEFSAISKKEVEEILRGAEDFVNKIERYLKEST